MLGATWIAYPSWLNPGDNAWQLTAATFVGLMSLPGLAVLYGGLVQRKWVVNTMLMAFSGFSLVLIVWTLWGFQMGFGTPAHWGATGSFWGDLVGIPRVSVSHFAEQNQATLPLVTVGPPFHFSESSLFYFQFVFAAITPLLFLGSVLGRMKFKAWLLFREPGVHDVTAIWMAHAAIPYVDLFSRLVSRRRSRHSDAESQLRPRTAKGYNREEGQHIARRDHLRGEPASAPEKNGQTEKDQQCAGQPKSLW